MLDDRLVEVGEIRRLSEFQGGIMEQPMGTGRPSATLSDLVTQALQLRKSAREANGQWLSFLGIPASEEKDANPGLPEPADGLERIREILQGVNQEIENLIGRIQIRT